MSAVWLYHSSKTRHGSNDAARGAISQRGPSRAVTDGKDFCFGVICIIGVNNTILSKSTHHPGGLVFVNVILVIFMVYAPNLVRLRDTVVEPRALHHEHCLVVIAYIPKGLMLADSATGDEFSRTIQTPAVPKDEKYHFSSPPSLSPFSHASSTSGFVIKHLTTLLRCMIFR